MSLDGQLWTSEGDCDTNAPALRPDGFSLHVLKTPVNVTLRRFAHGSDAVSASWNLSLAGGQGGWQSDGCRILGHHNNFTTISCNSLGNYGLLMVGVVTPRKLQATRRSSGRGHEPSTFVFACAMQDLSNVEFFSPSIQPLHPVIYATTVVLLLCLLTIIISYIYHHR